MPRKPKAPPYVPVVRVRDRLLGQPVIARPETRFTTIKTGTLSSAEDYLSQSACYRSCAFEIIKVVPLTPDTFKKFCLSLLMDWNFIKEANENPDPDKRPRYWSDLPPEDGDARESWAWTDRERRHFTAGVYLKVILVTDSTKRVLVDSSGYDYARSVAVLPDHVPVYVNTFDKPMISNPDMTIQSFQVLRKHDLPPLVEPRLKREADEYRQGFNGIWWPEEQHSRHYKMGLADRLATEADDLMRRAALVTVPASQV